MNQSQEQIIQVLAVCCECNRTRTWMLLAHVTKGPAVQNLKAREPQRIFLYPGEDMNKLFVSGGKVSVTHLYKKNCTDSLVLQ